MPNQQSAAVFLRIFEELSSHEIFLPNIFLLLLLQILFFFSNFLFLNIHLTIYFVQTLFMGTGLLFYTLVESLTH